MNVYVTLEHRFSRTPDGKIWTGGNLTYEFWTRYLSVFDHVTVVGRVNDVVQVPCGWRLPEGPAVRVHPIPGYMGPADLIRKLPRVRSAMKAVDVDGGAVILRPPGMVSALFRRFAMRADYPFGVEVVGDPWDVFSPGSVNHPLRPILRHSGAWRLRSDCRAASAVAYVSPWQLPERYPPAEGIFTTAYSSIELDPCHIAPEARSYAGCANDEVNLIMVGSLEQPYKGADVLLSAMAQVSEQFPRASLSIVGDGRYRPILERQAATIGIERRVRFLGQLPAGDQVREQLDRATLFVMPSRTEGLPRAMIEAMARALPCIGTSVGGIPELLAEEDLVPRDDATEIANRIVTVLSNPTRMAEMSMRNLQTANRYQRETLQKRRAEFYQVVHDKTVV